MTTTENRSVPDWFDGKPSSKPGLGRALYSTNRYPIFYLMILKTGCTFVRNLLYHIDHGHLHADAGRIHAYDDDFVKASHIPPEDITASPFVFAITRDPLDRFLSLYFDKIADMNNATDAWMRRRIGQAAGLDIGENLTIDEHRANCMKTLHWLRKNLDEGTEGRTNPHWQRQSVSVTRIDQFEPVLIPLPRINDCLSALLRDVVPDIRQQMSAVTIRNVSNKLFPRSEFATPEMTDLAYSIYADDVDIYASACRTADTMLRNE